MVRNKKKLPYEALTFTSVLKYCAILLLVCDVFYLHVNLRSVEESLKYSVHTIESLESQMKFTRLSYETFKADINYLTYLNRMFTKEINSKIELLIKLNKLFVDRADTSLNSIVSLVRNQKNDEYEVRRIVNKRNSNELPQRLHVNKTNFFSKEYYAANDLKNESAIEDTGFEVVLDGNNDDNFGFEGSEVSSQIMLNNATFDSVSYLHSDHRSKRQTTNNSRSNNRGKHHNGKSKNKGQHRHINCNLFCCSAGPLLAHFRGAQPEALIQDGGIIAPWFGDLEVSGDYIYRNVLLQEGRAKVEITEKGLYMIYAQVYYLTSNQLNSFSINIQNGKEVSEKVVAMCSTEAAVQGMSEVSCYTSVVHHLDPGDKIFLTQRERYRRVIFREGHTFLGIVALNNPPKC